MNIIYGDSLDKLKELEDNSIDSIVTDPPYGLSFMGKKWDYDVPSQEIWEECLRVLKPGGYLLAFAGTRTQHRMAVRIEDAGFEIRDMIAWVYGSGFPKSLNIGKAVDKIQGNEREVVGKTQSIQFQEKGYEYKGDKKGSGFANEKYWGFGNDVTKGNSPYEGWGTALKPSLESITVAQKKLDSSAENMIKLVYIIKQTLCQLPLFATTVKEILMLNQQEQKEDVDIAQWIAEKNINILEDLCVLMDMLQLKSMENSNWNIVLLWLSILEEIYKATNTSTTSTKLNTTIELKILHSMEWENIFQNIIQAKNNQTNGLSANVWNAESVFNALKLKLNYIQEHSAIESAILKENKKDFAPNLSPIIMSRKPISEKTVAQNVLKWGTGGINIDGCRVGSEVINIHNAPKGTFAGGELNRGSDTESYRDSVGRFPANLIHDGSDEVVGLFPESNGQGKHKKAHYEANQAINLGGGQVNTSYTDKGSASRFFYCAKSSKSERNKGVDSIVSIVIEYSIWKDINTTQQVKKVQLLVDMDKSVQKVIGVYGTESKNATEWNTMLFGNCTMEQFQKVNKSITKTTTNLITTSTILNWLTHLLTNDYTADVNYETENGGNLVENVANYNTLITTINEKMVSALGVNNVVLGTQLKISVKEGSNIHSTVKPISLMRYLCKLVTPKGGTVLDPFMGSGTTGIGAKLEGFDFIGIEREAEYIKIAEARINAWEEEKQKKLV